MQIRRLQVKNFRSLYDVDWRPGKLNVLIGPNAAGKSNVLGALELIAASARGRLAEHVQRQGGMETLVWDGGQNPISMSLRTMPFPGLEPCESIGADHQFEMKRISGGSSFVVTNEQVGWPEGEPESDAGTQSVGRQVGPSGTDASEDMHFKATSETLVSLGAPPHQVDTSFDEKLYPLVDLVRSLHQGLVRWVVHRNFDTLPEAPVRQATITRYEKHVSPSGDNLVSVLHTLYTEERDFRELADDYMRVAFGDDFEELVFRPAADQRVQLAIRWRGLDKLRSAADLSDGTLCFLYLLAILEAPELPPLIAIEEPDIGLHPSMLGAVAEMIVAASERSQVILTTHSAQFLDAFREVLPTVTVVTTENGKTSLTVVEGDDLEHWVKAYSSLGEFHRTGAAESLA